MSYYSDSEALKHYRADRNTGYYNFDDFTLKLIHPQADLETPEEYDRRFHYIKQIYSEHVENVNGQNRIWKLPSSFLNREIEEREDIDKYLAKNNYSHGKPLFTLPGHNFIGAGNTLPKPGQIVNKEDEPLDSDDDDAFNHDLAYTNAKSHKDVVKADKKFVHEQSDHILNNPIESAHHIIGAAGILIKQGAESILGPIYPGKYVKLLGSKGYI